MKLAADFRYEARCALKGHWGIAVIAGLLASLLGAVGSSGPELTYNFDTSTGFSLQLEYMDRVLYSTGGQIDPLFERLLIGGITVLVLASVAFALAMMFVGSMVRVGYARFNLDLADLRPLSVETLFNYFRHWRRILPTHILKGIIILLWFLLFAIPGIIAAYSYAMTDFILADDPTLPAKEVMRRSKEMMTGNRWRLFCLRLSFIGWDILAALTLGIGYLWLNPYRQAADAAFYKELTGAIPPAAAAEVF